jgi:uncharacterized protein with gpF-like domain
MRKLAQGADQLDRQAVLRAWQLIEDIRTSVTSRLATTDPARFSAAFFREYLTELDRVMREFGQKYARELGAAQRKAIELGAESVDEALGAQLDRRMHLGLPTIDPAMLEIAQGFTADLITGLTATIREQITRALRLGALGTRTPFETARAITKILGSADALEAGPLRGEAVTGIAYRAEVITRTEIGRMQSLAAEARLTKAAQVVPNLHKRWVAHRDKRTRDSHRKLHGTTIPWNDSFTVGPTKSQAFGPRDPDLPAAESVNCRCILSPVAGK